MKRQFQERMYKKTIVLQLLVLPMKQCKHVHGQMLVHCQYQEVGVQNIKYLGFCCKIVFCLFSGCFFVIFFAFERSLISIFGRLVS